VGSKFIALQKLGAGEFEHLNGSLLAHLNATYQLLKQWQATQHLCDAGLYHAAYGTDGFDTRVIALTRRNDIANIIGEQAEAIVYLYCACDRDYVFSRIGKYKEVHFKDRFTSKEFILTSEQASQFCELTVANELELAIDSQEFRNQYGKGLYYLLSKFSPYLTNSANDAIDNVLK